MPRESMTAKSLKAKQTTLCGLEFGPRNEEREKEIEKRKGWFLELCPANLFFYPPDRFRRDDKFQKKMRSIINEIGDRKDISVIHHSWGTVQKGENGPEVVTRLYTHNWDPYFSGWFFGEAEYMGRKSGAAVWETENRILNDIKSDIERAIPGAEVHMKTKFGRYRINAYNCKRGDRDAIIGIKEKYQRLYPNDVFDFTYKTRYGKGSHSID